eukprot:1569642-Prymnesium_polylepis.1
MAAAGLGAFAVRAVAGWLRAASRRRPRSCPRRVWPGGSHAPPHAAPPPASASAPRSQLQPRPHGARAAATRRWPRAVE